MGYENAVSTRLLATHCARCARPLRDVVSVQTGIGPDCREQLGYSSEGVDPAAWDEANKVTHEIAVNPKALHIPGLIFKLAALGFPVVADKLAQAIAEIKVTAEGDTLEVATPYSIEAVAILRTVPGRRWNKERKVNTYPVSSQGALLQALSRAFPGALGWGRKGLFLVPERV